jgi:LmbE family N-acetylglucosaminyl deacetylase
MMLQFRPDLPADGTILCFGAPCDDIEIGCGGTLIELRKRCNASPRSATITGSIRTCSAGHATHLLAAPRHATHKISFS